jgi:hypothetical protein
MNGSRILVGSCLLTILSLFTGSLSCVRTTLTTTLPTKTITLPVTQTIIATNVTVYTTVAVTNNTTIINPVASTITTTAPPLTTTTTVVPPPVTTTKPALTIIQFWPPVTGTNLTFTNYYLPALVKGQIVNFTITTGGFPLTYYIRNAANEVILNSKIEIGTLSSSGSFTVTMDGTYTMQCVPDLGLPITYFASYYIS